MGGLFASNQQQSTNTVEPVANGIRIQTSAYGLVLPVVYGLTRITGNLIWYGNFTPIPIVEQQQSGGTGAGKGGQTETPTSTKWNYTVAIAMGLCEGPILDVYSYWVDKKNISLHPNRRRPPITNGWTVLGDTVAYWNRTVNTNGISLFKGTYPQYPWTFLVTHHETEALPYPGLAYFAASAFNLGENTSLPNLTFLVGGLCPYYKATRITGELISLPDAVTTEESEVVPSSPPRTITVSHAAGWVQDLGVTCGTVSVPHTVTEGVYGFATAYAGSLVNIDYKYIASLPMTVSVWETEQFVEDFGVSYNGGSSLNRVLFTSPLTHQYSVNNYGVYTFNKYDYGKKVLIDYDYNALIGSLPSEILYDEWVSTKYGCSLATSKIAELDNYADYCLANNFYISPGLVEQEDARDIFTRQLLVTNSELVWSEGKIKIIPYGDQEITDSVSTFIESFHIEKGNLDYETQYLWLSDISVIDIASNRYTRVSASPVDKQYTIATSTGTYTFSSLNTATEVLINYRSSEIIEVPSWTPNITPIYNLTIDDFLVEAEAPIECIRNTPQDAYNHIQIEFLNEDNEYNPETAEYKDQANIEDYGLKTNSVIKAHEITDPEMAMKVAELICNKELYSRNTYIFNLGWKYCLLEPMDYITITEEGLGLDNQLVRIVEIEEIDDRTLKVTAEEVDIGTGTPVLYPSQLTYGNSPNNLVNPGTAATPIIFVPPLSLTTDPEIWMATSGGSYWGGCYVWISQDDTAYKYIGSVIGNSRYGDLTASLATSATVLDTINTISVDLTESKGALSSVSTIDVTSLRSLAYVDDEYIAYKNVTLTSSYNYDLDYLIRGCYGSNIIQHSTGSVFIRLDNAVFKYPIDRSDIGTTIYIKLQSYNYYGEMVQDLSEVNSYTYVIANPGDEILRAPVNLQITNNSTSPATKINVSFDLCDMQDSSGNVYTANGQGFVINFTQSGVNGLDSGSLASGQWYFIYSVANAIQGLVGGLGSNSSSAPVMPSGYTHKKLLGAFKTDGSANLVEGSQIDSEFLYDGLQSAYSGTSTQAWVDKDMSETIPTISTRGFFNLQAQVSSSLCTIALRKNGSTSNGQIITTLASGGSGSVDGWVDTDLSQVVELEITSSVSAWDLYVSGFRLSI